MKRWLSAVLAIAAIALVAQLLGLTEPGLVFSAGCCAGSIAERILLRPTRRAQAGAQ